MGWVTVCHLHTQSVHTGSFSPFISQRKIPRASNIRSANYHQGCEEKKGGEGWNKGYRKPCPSGFFLT